MKFHLPKKLLVAVLAAVSANSVQAGAVVEVDQVLNVPSGEEAIISSDASRYEHYYAVAKDGEGTAVITGNVTKYAGIYVREGELQIGDGETETTLRIEVTADNEEIYCHGICVSGKDAVVTFNKATYSNGGEIFNQVGGANGNGTMNITNGSVLNLISNSNLLIGNSLYCTDTTVTPGSSEVYQGNYTLAGNGSGVKFGKGIVNVTSGSTLNTGYHNFWMSEGEINVSGQGSSAVICNYYGNRTILSLEDNSTSSLNVSGGGKMILNSSNVYAGWGSNGVVNINVDGEGSELIRPNERPPHPDNGVTGATSTYIAYAGSGSETNINVTNGGKISFLSDVTSFNSKTSANRTANVTIDSKSTMLFNSVQMADGTTIENAGTMDASSLYMSGGSVANTGALSVDSDFCVYAGTVSNSGSIVVDYFEVSGEGSCFSFDSNSSLTADCTWITDSASVNYTYFGETSETGAPLTIIAIEDGYNEFDMDEGTNFNLELSGEYLSTLEGTEASLLVKVASGNLDNCDLNNTFTVSLENSVIWSAAGLEWSATDDGLYIVGTLTRNQEVIVDESGEVADNIADTDKKVSVVIKTDTTLSGDNTHTGGTDVNDAAVVLGSASALGNGAVLTQGDSSLSTSDGVTAMLPGVIANSGNLTMNGSYDGSNLSEITTDDTRVCVDGKEGNNGFYREGGTALVVVDNKGNATLTVDGETTVTNKNNEELKLYASGLAAGELNYGNYHLEDADHEASMSEIQAMRPDSTDVLTITLNDGKLFVDEDAENIQAKGGDIVVKFSGSTPVTVGGSLEGDVSLQVVDGTAELKGEHSYTGATTISGSNSKLIVGSDKALGQSDVLLKDGAVLDLGGKKLSNAITVEGCTIMGADNYAGDLTAVKDCNLEVIGDATANKITLKDNGAITGENILASAYEVASKATGSITANVATRNGGTITLSDGSILTVNGTLTLGEGTSFVLNGDYASGATLATADAVEGQTTGSVTLNGGYGTYTTNQGVVVLSAVFNQNYADALTVSNWGIATASRAMVNAVRGQRSNTGCIADGKGTAWVAILGGNNDINGSDISLSGAALGADMKVGEASRVGIAMGYVEGEVRPSGLRQVDQEGSYIAAYGEHGLKKLSSTSCLSMDWVAAYGVTDSEGAGQKWEQDSVQLNSRVNWNKKVNDKLCMSVFGGLEYFANNSDTVDGVKTGSIQNLRGEIGVGARYVAWGTPAVTDGKSGLVFAKGCEKLVLNGEIRYMNDMVRSNPVIRMEGLSGMGENPGRQGMGIEAGATYRIGERWSASANYGFNTMEDSKEHRVNVGAAYTF